MKEVDDYLKIYDFGNNITNPELWKEMDRVWDTFNLDNKLSLNIQNIGDFYAHPVWVLNGLFSEKDKISFSHRKLVVEYTKNYFNDKINLRIGDFGGGSGVLGKIFEESNLNIEKIDIIEPWPSSYFLDLLKPYKRIEFISNFRDNNYYDLIIAQDVLEHIENPIEIAFKCFDAVKPDGIIIFANCFYPVIKCHLPKNFYLRFLFKYVVTSKNLKYIGRVNGTSHMEVYQKIGKTNMTLLIKFKIILAKIIGNFINAVHGILNRTN